MASLPHEPQPVVERSRPTVEFTLRDLWASISICVIWLAVLFDAIFGPNIVSSSGAGTNTSTVPSAVVVALFASLATWSIAKYAFGRTGRDS
jgi:hypothetical protein